MKMEPAMSDPRQPMDLADVQSIAELLPPSDPRDPLLDYDGEGLWVAPAARTAFARIWKDGALTKAARDALAVKGAARALAGMQSAVEEHIEATAKARGYSSSVSCASYAGSTVPAWAADAIAFIAWRDAAWTAAFALQADVEAGRTAAPDDAEALVVALPKITWPKA
jgi:hypothetical protein